MEEMARRPAGRGQRPMAERSRVGFQGAPGAFSEEAALRLAPEVEPIPRSSFDDVVQAVESGEDRFGVLPVENTLAGTVTQAYDALAAGAVSVVAESAIPIRHCVLGVLGASVDGLREVRSHPVALAQCRDFLARHPQVRDRVVYDTAGAAREVADLGDPAVAAIASRRAAARYGLEILEGDVQDRDDNQTRFYVIVSSDAVRGSAAGRHPATGRSLGTEAHSASDRLKTSLIVELEHRAGSLHELLGVFARRDLSLTHLTSRPAPTPWTYRFVVELEHASRDVATAAVDEASILATSLRRLGTFPARDPDDRRVPVGARATDVSGDEGLGPT